jgi:Uma2 family endonuclease
MGPATKVEPFTFDDFCVLVKDGQKADLIDGVIYMASPDNLGANKLFVWLITLIDRFVEAQDLGGDVYGSRAAFKLDETNSPEPDVAYVSKERLHLAQKGHFQGPPDLAIEIVSPESVERDYNKKRRQYQRFGVAEYWIVDELTQKVTLLHLDPKGKYREIRPKKGELHSKVLPGFWIRPEWLWQTPRPKKSKVLNEILSRQR